MIWKIFTIACSSLLMIAFPQNIIGCGGGDYDADSEIYFFHNNLPDVSGYTPFYYTNYRFTYDDQEPEILSDLLSAEWANFCGKPVTKNDAHDFVMQYSWKDLNNLYRNIEKNNVLNIPDSVKKNNMTNYFFNSKDLEGLGYIMYAKKVEPYVTSSYNYWDTKPKADTSKMNNLIKGGDQLYKAAKKDFYKLKYAYQLTRLAHYSERYNDAINYYNNYVEPNPIESVLKPVSLSLKAGAYYHLGKSSQAIYNFSKCFAASIAKRYSNYISFYWSFKNDSSINKAMQFCKNNDEKANLKALYALSNADNSLAEMQDVYTLNPTCPVLEVLAVREINKLENNYLGPKILKSNGSTEFYYRYNTVNLDSTLSTNLKEAKSLIDFFHTLSINTKIKNRGLFETGAAYIAYMIEDNKTAKQYLANAATMPLSLKVKDQCMFTSLLVSINEKDKIDDNFEAEILPSIEWLEKKAKLHEVKNYYNADDETKQWRKFYINLFNIILSTRYHKQGDKSKELLSIGMADWMQNDGAAIFDYSTSVGKLRSECSSEDVEKLYTFFTKPNPTIFEKYLFNHSALKKINVVDFAGTAYLREYNYSKAIEWFKKQSDQNIAIHKNPFVDLTYDREEELPSDANHYTTKLEFSQTMLDLQQAIAKNKNNLANNLYKMALGLYNMTYYGHAWELVEYNRSGTDGYFIPKDATNYVREYYGAFSALAYFEKAMNASYDNNFKAKCLFMMAKCSQKQINAPQYSDYKYSYDSMDIDRKKYEKLFMHNKYFPQLIADYKNTPFFNEVSFSCSYLSDFIKKNK